MPKVISVHEYNLKLGVDFQSFEAAFHRAKTSGLFNISGLVESYLVKGIKGSRHGDYAAIWVYESQETWERLWGKVGSPKSQSEYPPGWRIWEDEILSQFLEKRPDKIRFTSYLCID